MDTSLFSFFCIAGGIIAFIVAIIALYTLISIRLHERAKQQTKKRSSGFRVKTGIRVGEFADPDLREISTPKKEE